MKNSFCFLLVVSCASIVAVAQVDPPGGGGGGGGGGANCNITCYGIIDFYNYVSPTPLDGEYPHFAFIEVDGPCHRIWRVDSTMLSDPDGEAIQQRYDDVDTDVPTCLPFPADDAAETMQRSFITAPPEEQWITICYETCTPRT